MPGQIQLAKQPFYRDTTITDKRHPKIAGFTNIRVCSDTKTGKILSPMYLGPVDHAECDEKGEIMPPCVRFENFWQGMKVFTFELSADKQTILSAYFIRRNKNFMDDKGHRRIFPKKVLLAKKAKAEFTYYNGLRYSYLEARKKIYCPLYAELVQKTDYFKELKERLNAGENLLIIGYDGFAFNPATDDAKMHLNDGTKALGHEFVICCLLFGIQPWLE